MPVLCMGNCMQLPSLLPMREWLREWLPLQCPSLGRDMQTASTEDDIAVGSAQWRLWGKRYAGVTFNWSKEAFPFPFPG